MHFEIFLGRHLIQVTLLSIHKWQKSVLMRQSYDRFLFQIMSQAGCLNLDLSLFRCFSLFLCQHGDRHFRISIFRIYIILVRRNEGVMGSHGMMCQRILSRHLNDLVFLKQKEKSLQESGHNMIVKSSITNSALSLSKNE